MSDNVETLRKCTRCVQKFPVEDWGKKPNGDYYQYCNACRVDNRAIWHKKPKEIKDSAAQNTKDKLLYDPEYRKQFEERSRITRSRRVNCPICDKEVAHHCLSKHKKSSACVGSVPVV